MLVLADIVMTILAWRKGWKWWALAPFAVAFVISIISGVVVEASGGSVDSSFFQAYIGCLYALIGFTLVGMWYFGRR